MEDIRQLQKELQDTRSKLINYTGFSPDVTGQESVLSSLVRQIPDAIDRRTIKKANKILKKIEKIRRGPGEAFGDLEYQLDLADPRSETLPAVPPEGQIGTDYRTGEAFIKYGSMPAVRKYNKKKKTKKYFSKNKNYANKPRKARTRGR